MNGKEKCRILKEIRREIAQNNDIEWAVSECKHQGNCKGTCPKCEAEVRKLEAELSLRRRLGKAVAVVGISSLCTAGLTACSIPGLPDIPGLPWNTKPTPGIEDIAGEIDTMPESETEDIELDGEITCENTDFIELEGDVPER